MEISYAFFAEAIQLTSDQRVNILGVDLQSITVRGNPPWLAPPIALLVNIQMGREDGGRLYHFTADLVAPNGERMDPHAENAFVAPVQLVPDLQARMMITVQMNGLTLPATGLYHMLVRAEDRERNVSVEKRVLLRVADASPQQNPPGTGA